MHKFSPVYIKTLLICFICNSIPHSFSKHHHITPHVVIHHIFKLWHEGFFVDYIKVDKLLGYDLNSNIAFDIVNETSLLYGMK